jgi:DNA-binding winged helix-turn-helix (wHTH) protein/Tol biopolymer transport system component
MSLETNRFEFGEFLLDAKEKVLLRDGKPLAITPKAFQLLQILVENHGHLVEREELLNSVWADSFVEEGNLTFTIRMLRKILGDSKQNPQFIETVPKRGYRFVAQVRPIEVNAEKNEKFKLIEKPPFSPRINKPQNSEIRSSGVVVALADWRHETAETEPETESLPTVPKLELVQPIPPVKTNRRYVLAGLMAAVGLAALGFSLFYFLVVKKSTSFRVANLTRLTSNGKTKVAAVAPDGRFAAYVLDEEGVQCLWLKNVAAGSDVQILPPAEMVELSNLTFSPDGNFVYYSAQGTLYQLPILGGLPKMILPNFGINRFPNPISFAPDGKQFAFMRRSTEGEETASLVIVNADGTDERILATSKPPDIFWGSAVWSPDGQVIAVTAFGKIYVVRVADGVVSTISPPGWANVLRAVWHPSGKSLLVVASEGRSSISNQIWSLSYPGGEAQNISNDLNNYQSISLTKDGSELVAVRVEQLAYIWAMSGAETSQAGQLTKGIDRYDGLFGLSCLSDGRIIYETVPRNGNGEVWITDAEGRNSKQIASEAGSSVASPDGKFLVFQSKDAEGTGLFRLNLSNGEKKRLTKGTDTWAAFSPDGNRIIFTRWGEQVALWKISIDGGEAEKLTNVSGYALAPTVSSDGKLIAFYWQKLNRQEPPEIAVLSIDGGEVINKFKLPFQYSQSIGKNALQWTPDGQAIRHLVLRDGVSNIWQQPIDGTPPVQITNFTDQRIFNFSYSPDGKQLALSRGTFNRDVILIKSGE